MHRAAVRSRFLGRRAGLRERVRPSVDPGCANASRPAPRRECRALARDERAFDVLALVGGAELVVPNARDAARIDAVRERLAGDVGASASLAAIARDAGLSPFHLARRFRARTGTSLHQYRLALRLAAAQARLLDGADDLTHLALDLGFASLAHFSAAFRHAYGRSPSSVRRGALLG